MTEPHLELCVAHAQPERDRWGAETPRRATKADLRALAAYLQAMSEDPVEGTVTIGRLVVELYVDRCTQCNGGKQNPRPPYDACSLCRGSGRTTPEPPIIQMDPPPTTSPLASPQLPGQTCAR